LLVAGAHALVALAAATVRVSLARLPGDLAVVDRDALGSRLCLCHQAAHAEGCRNPGCCEPERIAATGCRADAAAQFFELRSVHVLAPRSVRSCASTAALLPRQADSQSTLIRGSPSS